VNERFGASLESGLNNSPMYDDVPFDSERHVLQMWDVGLNGLYVADCEALADIADELNRPTESQELRQRAGIVRAAMSVGVLHSLCVARRSVSAAQGRGSLAR
jgi:hypothetical protein